MKQCMIHFCARAGHILHQRKQNLETSNIACKKEKERHYDCQVLILQNSFYHMTIIMMEV